MSAGTLGSHRAHISLTAGRMLEGAVELWIAGLDSLARLGFDEGVLSSDERRRGALLHGDEAKRRFLGGRYLLRCVLSTLTRQPPDKINLEYGNAGKPSLAPKGLAPELHFNLSHCNDWYVLAISRDGPVGIDIEEIRYLDISEVASCCCTPHEQAALQTRKWDERLKFFFRLWVRKEAVLKATGFGLTVDPREIETCNANLELDEVVTVGGGNWRLYEVPLTGRLVAALAIDGHGGRKRGAGIAPHSFTEAHSPQGLLLPWDRPAADLEVLHMLSSIDELDRNAAAPRAERNSPGGSRKARAGAADGGL